MSCQNAGESKQREGAAGEKEGTKRMRRKVREEGELGQGLCQEGAHPARSSALS